jgi:hypothetical protein
MELERQFNELTVDDLLEVKKTAIENKEQEEIIVLLNKVIR